MSDKKSKREKLISDTAMLLFPNSKKYGIAELVDKNKETLLNEEKKHRYANLIKSGVDLDEYKKSIAIDLLEPVIQNKETMKKFISGVYDILGYIPKLLTEVSGYFKEFAEAITPKTPSKITYPTNMYQAGFKNYGGTLPIVTYSTSIKLKVERTNVELHHGQYAALSFLLWPERFVQHIEPKSEFGSRYLTNNVSGILMLNIPEVNNARFEKYNKEHYERKLTKSGKPRKKVDTFMREPYLCYGSSIPAWHGSLIYKPDMGDIEEIESVIKRLIQSAPEGNNLSPDMLRYLNPAFEEMVETLKEAGQFMFRFQVLDGGPFATTESPEKFKKMAECFHKMGDLASKLSEQFDDYAKRKMIGKRTSDASFGAKLLAEEILVNPIRFINECFSPGNWYKEDSIIYWLCKEIIQGG